MKRANCTVSKIRQRNVSEGENIIRVMQRALSNKESIGAEVGLIYTEKSQGLLPAYDIRTDRFEIALDGIDKIQKSRDAKRDALAKPVEKVVDNESTQGTE